MGVYDCLVYIHIVERNWRGWIATEPTEIVIVIVAKTLVEVLIVKTLVAETLVGKALIIEVVESLVKSTLVIITILIIVLAPGFIFWAI